MFGTLNINPVMVGILLSVSVPIRFLSVYTRRVNDFVAAAAALIKQCEKKMRIYDLQTSVENNTKRRRL